MAPTLAVAWSYGSDGPERDTAVSIEVEAAALMRPEPLQGRTKWTGLWRFLTGR